MPGGALTRNPKRLEAEEAIRRAGQGRADLTFPGCVEVPVGRQEAALFSVLRAAYGPSAVHLRGWEVAGGTGQKDRQRGLPYQSFVKHIY